MGVEKDTQQAVTWYRKAAEQNNPDAQMNLGRMYENGIGLKKDYPQALVLYRKAANQMKSIQNNKTNKQKLVTNMDFHTPWFPAGVFQK
jgi:TPR repeat protein